MKTKKTYSQETYQKARQRVEEIKSFYLHLAIYLIFVVLFIYLNSISTSYPWAIFPILGWGLGVLGHALGAFDWNPLFSKQWEARKIREYMDKDSK